MLETIPKHLAERTRITHESECSASNPDGQFVLYWMRTAVRSDGNPALDVAKWLADRQGVPLLIDQAIFELDEYASDRHHTFMLQ